MEKKTGKDPSKYASDYFVDYNSFYTVWNNFTLLTNAFPKVVNEL